MKKMITVLMALSAVLVSTNNYANNNPQCPSIESVRNATFFMADKWGGEWIVMSSPIASENKSDWNVLVDLRNDKLNDSSEAIDYVKSKMQSVALAQPQPTKRGDSLECWYASDIEFQVVAGYPAQAPSHAMFIK